MAAATEPITGDTGRIIVDGAIIAQFFSWKLNPKAETKSTRAYDDPGGWERNSEATLKMYDGSAEGNYVMAQYDSLFVKLGKKVAVKFVTQRDAVDPDAAGVNVGTEYGYSGDVILVGMPISHQVGEIVTVSLEFKGTGVLALYNAGYSV